MRVALSFYSFHSLWLKKTTILFLTSFLRFNYETLRVLIGEKIFERTLLKLTVFLPRTVSFYKFMSY